MTGTIHAVGMNCLDDAYICHSALVWSEIACRCRRACGATDADYFAMYVLDADVCARESVGRRRVYCERACVHRQYDQRPMTIITGRDVGGAGNMVVARIRR